MFLNEKKMIHCCSGNCLKRDRWIFLENLCREYLGVIYCVRPRCRFSMINTHGDSECIWNRGFNTIQTDHIFLCSIYFKTSESKETKLKIMQAVLSKFLQRSSLLRIQKLHKNVLDSKLSSVNTEFVFIQGFSGKHRNWLIWSDLSEVDAM